MAVLWRSMESGGHVDERFRDDTDPSPAVRGKFAEKNTFMEKHVRILDPLPSEEDMKAFVKKIYVDRNKGPKQKVPSVTGATYKTKQQLYGGDKPPANTTLFIGLAGFQETNAWIEKNVSASNAHAQVPILGNGTVVTYDGTTNTFSVVKAGKLKLSIAVGADASFKSKSNETQTLTMNSKVVYHFAGVA